MNRRIRPIEVTPLSGGTQYQLGDYNRLDKVFAEAASMEGDGEIEYRREGQELPPLPTRTGGAQEHMGHSDVRDAFSLLSEDERAVLWPQYFEGKSAHEVALAIGKPTSEVDELTTQALNHLKELLES